MLRARRPLLLLALSAALGACYADKASGGKGPMSGTGLPIPDGGALDANQATDGPAAPDAPPVDAPATDTPAPVDSRPGDSRDVAAAPDLAMGVDLPRERPATSMVPAYQQFLDEQWKVWSGRWSSCFNAAAETLSADRSPLLDDIIDLHEFSLDRGMAALDDARVKACLDSLRTVPCEGLATRAYQATCAQVLVGKVGSGGFCVSPEDCLNATDACQMKDTSGCISRCAPRVPLAAAGESCVDRVCAPDTICYADTAAQVPTCHRLDLEGAACPDQTCVPGSWCAPAVVDVPSGTCKRVQPGGACQGSWQCPFPYACLLAAGAQSGVCGAGRKLGEACALHGLAAASGPYSDCAVGLFCYPDAAGKLTCGAGRTLGQSCADLEVGGMNPLTVPCRDSWCRMAPSGPLTCMLDGKLGATCTVELPCEQSLVCDDTNKCRSQLVGLGERCTLDGSYACPEGSRCAPNAADMSQGLCVSLKKPGEACSGLDDCEPGAACTGGICLGCK